MVAKQHRQDVAFDELSFCLVGVGGPARFGSRDGDLF